MQNHHEIATKEFHRNSPIMRLSKNALKFPILHFCDKENKEAYEEQFDEASQNVGIMVDNLLNFNISRLPFLFYGIYKWGKDYYGARENCKNKEKYLIYTEFDREIPFIPEEDLMYTYMISQLAYVGKHMSKSLKLGEMKKFIEGFVEINKLGAEAFNNYPTLMPRFYNHNRITMKTIQMVDKPVNCCPSLHIAYSLMLDNVAEKLLKEKFDDDSVFDSIRYSTKRMFNSVLYTKQHSLIDIAFGTLASKIGFEKIFEMQFNDFTGVYDELKADNPQIDYNKLNGMYAEALRIYNKTGNFGESVGRYLGANGFVKVKPWQDVDSCYFDTYRRRLVEY